jgi:NAD+ kinase
VIYIFGQKAKEGDLQYVKELEEYLSSKNIEHKYYEPFYIELTAFSDIKAETFSHYSDVCQDKPEYLISLGGDGTILSAMTILRDSNTPIIGINLGRLGFLASIEKHRISEAMDQVFQGKYSLMCRSMITLESESKLFGEIPFALNDFTISKRDTSSMVIIHTYIDGEFLNSYWADGLIVATPTGSTGYSLSCGGPIIYPSSGNLVITPIAPHNLNVRPMVIPDDKILSFEIEGRSKNFLCTLDARYETIHSDQRIFLKRNAFDANLVNLDDVDFLKTIRSKLNWGLDKRN